MAGADSAHMQYMYTVLHIHNTVYIPYKYISHTLQAVLRWRELTRPLQQLAGRGVPAFCVVNNIIANSELGLMATAEEVEAKFRSTAKAARWAPTGQSDWTASASFRAWPPKKRCVRVCVCACACVCTVCVCGGVRVCVYGDV